MYYASELRVLVVWLRLPDPSHPPVAPAWHVLACAAGFAMLAVGAAADVAGIPAGRLVGVGPASPTSSVATVEASVEVPHAVGI